MKNSINPVKILLGNAGIGTPHFSYWVNENKTSFLQSSLLDVGYGQRAKDSRKNRINEQKSVFYDGHSLYMTPLKSYLGDRPHGYPR